MKAGQPGPADDHTSRLGAARCLLPPLRAPACPSRPRSASGAGDWLLLSTGAKRQPLSTELQSVLTGRSWAGSVGVCSHLNSQSINRKVRDAPGAARRQAQRGSTVELGQGGGATIEWRAAASLSLGLAQLLLLLLLPLAGAGPQLQAAATVGKEAGHGSHGGLGELWQEGRAVWCARPESGESGRTSLSAWV